MVRSVYHIHTACCITVVYTFVVKTRQEGGREGGGGENATCVCVKFTCLYI